MAANQLTLPRRREAAHVARSAARRLPLTFGLRERHHWAELDRLQRRPRPRPKPALPDGWRLDRAGLADLDALEELGIDFADAADQLAAGHTWYLIRHGRQPVASAWAFAGFMPTNAVPSGWISLPNDMVNVDDAYLHPAYRSIGMTALLMGAVLAAVAADHPARRMITLMHHDNLAARTSIGRVGFREFAVVDIEKTGVDVRRNWRNRRADGPGVRTRVEVEEYRGTDAIPASESAAELTRWLSAALRA